MLLWTACASVRVVQEMVGLARQRRNLGIEHFQRDRPVDRGLNRPVNLAPPAPADFLLDPERTQRLPHETGWLRVGVGHALFSVIPFVPVVLLAPVALRVKREMPS